MRVLIVADNASFRMGGESVLPLHYFKGLLRRKVETWLVVHERNKAELTEAFPDHLDRIFYFKDTATHKSLWAIAKRLPDALRSNVFGYLLDMASQLEQRRLVRQVVDSHRVSLVHQPAPVSPLRPSALADVGAPVVFGPLNGGMDFPPAFRDRQGRSASLVRSVGRGVARLFDTVMTGKAKAALILVANKRTQNSLPPSVRSEIVRILPENGVDMDVWTSARANLREPSREISKPEPVPTFVFMGRLVNWKAVDLLLKALALVAGKRRVRLEIIGDGEERPALEAQARALWPAGSALPCPVVFKGWMPQAECARRVAKARALVLPSLLECGGAVVLEAMAASRPVIAANWGGPADYLDDRCGILVDPRDETSFVEGLAHAMVKLTDDPELADRLGESGREKVDHEYNWSRKVDHILMIYSEVADRAAASAA